MLGIHGDRFAGGYSEELCVESIDSAEKGPVASQHLAGFVRIGAKVGGNVPASLRHFAHRVDSVSQESPECFRIVGAAGEAAPHADDGDGLVPLLLEGPDSRLVLPQFEESTPHQLLVIGLGRHGCLPIQFSGQQSGNLVPVQGGERPLGVGL